MIRRKIVTATVALAASVAVAGMLPASSLGANRDVFAQPVTWSPTRVNALVGDQVTWHFDDPANTNPHDVWLVPPGGDPDPMGADIFEVTSGVVVPDGPPVSHTLDQEGTWTYVCQVHSTFAGGAWSGMVGTARTTTTLGLSVKPKRKKATPGRKVAFRATTRNTGTSTATNVRVCAKAPKRKVKVVGKRCRTRAGLARGTAWVQKFKLKPKKSAAGKKVKVTFIASASNAATKRTKATLKVRK